MHLCPMVASKFRGAKNIDFEELEGAARVGLCEAAADWKQLEKFASFAQTAMTNQIKNFIRDWGPRTIPAEDPETEFPHQVIQIKPDYSKDVSRIYEWDYWTTRQFVMALCEYWDDDELANNPEGLAIAFDEIKGADRAIRSALISATERDRTIFNQRFFSEPRQTLESIARSHNISYARTVFIIDRIIKQIREIVESREAAIPSAMRG